MKQIGSFILVSKKQIIKKFWKQTPIFIMISFYFKIGITVIALSRLNLFYYYYQIFSYLALL